MRIALATNAEFADLFFDDEPLRNALLARGADVAPAVWDDPAQDWASYDLVVLRSVWDYVERRDEFVAWAHAVPRLANSARLVEWNTDKTYLRGLAEAGVPVVPTAWVTGSASLDVLLRERGWPRAVVKPAVSAGARDTMLSNGADPAAQALLDRLAANGTAMVQPYLPSVEDYGERSLLFMGGRLTHAVRRNPALSTDGFTRYDARLVDVAPEELAVARAVLAALDETPLYARVDLARDEAGAPLLMELEVTEPQLFLRFSEPAAQALADATVALAGSAGSSTTTGS
jgi:glutathione synthase/RimK-type ligase-like ATP-grasp enzyme